MKLSSKLSMVLIVAVLTAGVLISVFSLEATKSSFDQYIFKVREAQLDQWEDIYAQYYSYQGSWKGIENLNIMGGSMTRGKGHGMGQGMQGMNQGMGRSVNQQGVVLADVDGTILNHPYSEEIGSSLDQSFLVKGRQINVEGQVVGYLFPQELFIPDAQELEQKFKTSVLYAVILGTLLASLVAIIFGLWWSKKLTKPLEKLVSASQKVAKGDFKHNLSLDTRDELGSVANAFNKMAKELDQSQKVRQQMFADVSHELRTPLTILGSKLEASLESNSVLDSNQMSSLYDEVIRLQGLVQELQDLSNLEAGQINLNIEKINPGQFIQDLGFLLDAEASAREIEFKLDVDSELDYIKADIKKLKQIILNLVSNAFRYTQAGGLVQLTIRKKDEKVIIEVMDTGPGIISEDLAHIFERFYRADKSRNRATGGTGLGLAIAKGYVEAHKGEIRVDSEVGKGTRFIVSLPQ